MKGFPKTINSHQDVLNLLADPTTKPTMLTKLQTLLDERYDWVLQGQLDINATATAEAGTKIVLKDYVRFQLGEGIEKEVTDFAAEVAAAVKG